MKSYTVVLSGKEYEILQDIDGKFIKPDFVKQLESYGTDVKPAHEPICVARKPVESTVANNVLKYGTGGLNIDGSRVGTETTVTRGRASGGTYEIGLNNPDFTKENIGRFPANLIHDGSDEVVGLFPDTSPSKSAKRGSRPRSPAMVGDRSYTENSDVPRGHNDNGGSAARFFYCAKSSKSERNLGLEGFEVKEAPKFSGGDETREGKPSLRPLFQNYHPTVKPLSLTKYLANLIKPPTGGRLLVPFSGSGSEMIGALQAGWEYVEGVELTEEYIPIAEARIKYWLSIKEEETKQLALV